MALSRMAAAGELEAVDGSYELAGRLLARQTRQLASRAAKTGTWTGAGSPAVVTVERRSAADRTAWRSAMSGGAWPSCAKACGCDPTTSVRSKRCPTTWTSTAPGCTTPTPRRAVARPHAVGPGRVGRPAGRPARGIRPLLRPLDRHDTGAGVRASSCRPRCCATSKPTRSCPPSCCPGAGPALRSATEYDRFDAAYRAVLREWFRTNT